MVGIDHTIPDSHGFQNRGTGLVCLQILIFVFQTHVVPDKILCLVYRAGSQAFFRQIQTGKMIPVHHQYRILSAFLKHIDQLTHKLIHLIHLIGVIGNLIQVRFILDHRTGDRHMSFIIQLRIGRIASVSLNGYSIDKIRLLRGIQCFFDLICQYHILCPVHGCKVLRPHVFQRSKCIKAHVSVNIVPAVKSAYMIMHRMSGITILRQIVSQCLTGRFLENRFIWIFTGSEIIDIHAGQHFKLCIYGTCTDNGNIEKSGSAGFHQFCKIGNRVL